MLVLPALALIVAYLVGGVPFGFLLVKWKTGRDVREMGSGNIGATNVLRTSGRAAGVVVLLLDIAKGWLAVWIAARLTEGNVFWMCAAALAVIAGHAFPPLLKFRGGKAVASFIGAFLYLAPWPLFATLLLFVIVVAKTRFISLGSVVAAGSFPFAVWLINHPPLPVFVAALTAGAFIVYRHRENLARLRTGTESVFSFRGKRS